MKKSNVSMRKGFEAQSKLIKSFLTLTYTSTFFIVIYIIANNAYLSQSEIEQNYSFQVLLKSHHINDTILDNFNLYIRKHCPVRVLNVSKECLDALKNYELPANDTRLNLKYQIKYHTFWRITKHFDYQFRMMNLNILSFLATQPLHKSKLIVWTVRRMDDFYSYRLKMKFKQYFSNNSLELKTLDYVSLCSHGLFKLVYETCTQIGKIEDTSTMVAYSDFVRFLILYNYGGIYTDGDVVFLRDMTPFHDINFAYRWSALNVFNTGIMGLRRELNEFVEQIYEVLLHRVSLNDPQALPQVFYPKNLNQVISQLNNQNIYDHPLFIVYHSILFDPIWLCNDGYNHNLNEQPCSIVDFFYKNVTNFVFEKFFAGAYTYHLHFSDCKTCFISINNQSYFVQIEKYFLNILNLL